jgi:3-mercaptopyruvate sulfurtransferase SseA
MDAEVSRAAVIIERATKGKEKKKSEGSDMWRSGAGSVVGRRGALLGQGHRTLNCWGKQRLLATSTRSPWVSVEELRQTLEAAEGDLNGQRVVLVDTRGAEAYGKGHLNGAVRIEECFTQLATSDAAGLASLEATFRDLFGGRAGLSGSSNERVVFYEEGLTSGFAQSCRGYFLLKWLGHPNVLTSLHFSYLRSNSFYSPLQVSVLQGGLAAWRNAGGKLSQETPRIGTSSSPYGTRPPSAAPLLDVHSN